MHSVRSVQLLHRARPQLIESALLRQLHTHARLRATFLAITLPSCLTVSRRPFTARQQRNKCKCRYSGDRVLGFRFEGERVQSRNDRAVIVVSVRASIVRRGG